MTETPGNFDGVLHGQEESRLGALVGLHVDEVLAVESRRSAGDVVAGVTGEGVGEGALARPVRAHQRVHLALWDREVDALQDRRVLNGHFKAGDLKDGVRRCHSVLRVVCGREWGGGARGRVDEHAAVGDLNLKVGIGRLAGGVSAAPVATRRTRRGAGTRSCRRRSPAAQRLHRVRADVVDRVDGALEVHQADRGAVDLDAVGVPGQVGDRGTSTRSATART